MAMREGADTRDRRDDQPFVTAAVRYLDDSGEPVERHRSLTDEDCADDVEGASPRLRQDLVVAMLTDHLTEGPWSESVSARDLRDAARGLPSSLQDDRDVRELVDLVDRATRT